MKNLEYTLNLHQLKRELILKEEKLKTMEIQSSLTISRQSEEIKEAQLKIEKLENMLLASKRPQLSNSTLPIKHQENCIIERVEISVPQEGPDWKEVVDQLKIQLKLKTEIIKNMQKINAKPSLKPVLARITHRSTQTDADTEAQAHYAENRIKKELTYYKGMHENQEILKEEVYSWKAKANSLQAQSLENESLKWQLSKLQKEFEVLLEQHSKTLEELSLKQLDTEKLKIETEKCKRSEITSISKYEMISESLSRELHETKSNMKRLERLGEIFQLEISLLKENLRSFDLEITQMTDLKLDSLKEQRIKDLEMINQQLSIFQSSKADSQFN